MRKTMEKSWRNSDENARLNARLSFTSKSSNVAGANSITAQIGLIGDGGVGKTSILTQYVR
jgi:GTPase SAR1 family protein